jgi:hypothetical protein
VATKLIWLVLREITPGLENAADRVARRAGAIRNPVRRSIRNHALTNRLGTYKNRDTLTARERGRASLCSWKRACVRRTAAPSSSSGLANSSSTALLQPVVCEFMCRTVF